MSVHAPARANISAKTYRTDKWWLQPLGTVAVLLSFIVYATWRAFDGAHYFTEPLISPFYSPCLATSCVEKSSLLGTPVGAWWTLSPALLILVFAGRVVGADSRTHDVRLAAEPDFLTDPLPHSDHVARLLSSSNHMRGDWGAAGGQLA